MRIRNKRGKGAKKISILVGIFVLFVLVANLAPVALGGDTGIFNQNRNGSLTCSHWNTTTETCTVATNVPGWVPTTLGILAVIAFVFIMIRASKK